jgi:hypothetical protein
VPSYVKENWTKPTGSTLVVRYGTSFSRLTSTSKRPLELGNKVSLLYSGRRDKVAWDSAVCGTACQIGAMSDDFMTFGERGFLFFFFFFL